MINIVSYQEELGHYFVSINKAWIEKYFELEPVDEKVLDQHQNYILDKGGFIFFAKDDNRVVGTVALKKESDGIYELTKMGVIPKYQGRGIGTGLVKHCINFARLKGIGCLFLDSSRKLKNALHIYAKMGFTEIPVPSSEYHRCDIRMEIHLDDLR